tara:strand:- start:605 stop:1096 length:492 start_codon:yes stop_codon:yes gene_type:complete
MKRNTVFIVITLIILGGLGLMWMSQPSNTGSSTTNATASKSSAALVAEVGQYDFGTININGGNVTTEFPVTNTGEEPIVILDGTTSCACTKAEIESIGFDMHNGMKQKVTIQPGETKMLTTTYDPLFHGPNSIGKITREVILKTNSVVTPEVRMRFAADVIKG